MDIISLQTEDSNTSTTKTTTTPSPSSSSIMSTVSEILKQKNAVDINIIDLKGKSDIADYMIIASGNNTTHVGALSEYILKALKENNIIGHIEGRPLNEWVLVDSPYVIVHLFKPETREIYHLDKMWSA